MSAAAFATRLDLDSSSSSHLPHTLHPRPLRDQAFELHCHGLRSPAISEQLGVPERTIRSWIAADLKALAEEQRATRREQLALAVERQHALTATAWREFEAETAARHALLDALLQALTNLTVPNRSATSSGNQDSPRLPHLPASTPAPRYLSLILQANKEIARLLGLYTLAKLDLLTPDAPVSPALDPSSTTETDIPAESATDTASLCLSVPSVVNRHSPAESATAPNGLAAGIQPANLNGAIPSPTGPTSADFELPAKSATSSRNRPTPQHPVNRSRRRHRR